jgi:hypothetical protein
LRLSAALRVSPVLLLAAMAAAALLSIGAPAPAGATEGAPEMPITGFPPLHVEPPLSPPPGTIMLYGTLNPHVNAKTGYYFVIHAGAQCSGGYETSAGEVEGEAVEVSAAVTGLTANTEYAYCLVATNSFGETPGNSLLFRTPYVAPIIDSESANSVTQTGATLQAKIDPNEEVAYYTFLYSTAASMAGATTLAEGSIPENESRVVSATIAGGLAPNTTYYYRVTAVNMLGGSEGSVESFTTPPEKQQEGSGSGSGSGSNSGAGSSSGSGAGSGSSSGSGAGSGSGSGSGSGAGTSGEVGLGSGLGSSSLGLGQGVTPTTFFPAPAVKSHALTTAQRLARALKTCRKQPHRLWAGCERAARKRYRAIKQAKSSKR